MPLALDQGVGLLVWSPLGWGRLTGKIDRQHPVPPALSRLHKSASYGPPVDDNYLFDVVAVLEEISKETGKGLQIAINWLTERPTVANIILGARNEAQLLDNLGSVGWKLTPDQMDRLNKVSQRPLHYPYWHQRGFQELIPPLKSSSGGF